MKLELIEQGIIDSFFSKFAKPVVRKEYSVIELGCDIQYKICNKCKIKRKVTEFSKSKSRKWNNFREYECKFCSKSRRKNED